MESFTIDSNGDHASPGSWKYAPGQKSSDRDIPISKVICALSNAPLEDPRDLPLRRWGQLVERSLAFLPSARQRMMTCNCMEDTAQISKTKMARNLKSVSRIGLSSKASKSSRFGMFHICTE
jgi:hypothetical protein